MKCKLHKTDNPNVFRLVDEDMGKPVELPVKIGKQETVIKIYEFVTKMEIQDLKIGYGLDIDDSEL